MQPQFVHPSSITDRRELDRSLVRLIARTGTDRQAYNFTILDLSSTGCMVEIDGNLHLGVKATVEFPGGYVETAEVVWCRAGKAGLAFVKPLSKAVLSSAKLRSDHWVTDIVGNDLDPAIKSGVDQFADLADRADSEKLPYHQRLRIIVALALLPWLVGFAAMSAL